MNAAFLLFDVALKHGVAAEDIKSKSRRADIAKARHEFCYRCRHELGMTTHVIGQIINRDFSTVYASIQKYAEGVQ